MARQRFLRRLLLRAVILLAVLVVLGLAAAWLLVDRLAKTAIERGGTYALGVETTIEDVDLKILGGTLRIDAMTVANPGGFDTPHAVRFDQFDFAIDTGSILSDPVVMHNIEMTGLEVHIEQKLGKNNIATILENVRRFESKSPAEKQEEGSGTRIVVDRLVINEVKAHVHLFSALGGDIEPITVVVPRIELAGLTSDNARGMLIGELFAKVIPAIIEAVLTAGEGTIPLPTVQDLRTHLTATAESLGGIAELLDHVREEDPAGE
ncbi:MAG: hypothetical protein GVY16_07460 [Planctomycetes bacterium]|jgi:hypothetical protein|nr:hypothetical protein [Phycisphaerae bacterium]NBB95563.1 hypothetical protein [Planctomycetota bacterium]